MSTLNDLRATLDEHADSLHDTERYVRPVAVRQRIRAARRRRSAAVAVAAAAVVAAGAIGVAALRQPEPVAPASEVLGVDVPGTVEISGFPYTVTRTVELDPQRLRLTLDSADEERAVTLVAQGLGDNGLATLYADGEPIARVQGDGDIEAPVPVYASELRVRFVDAPASARAGLAVYESTGELADGVTDAAQTAVFRDTVGGDELLAGAFSEPGTSEVSVAFTAAFSDVRFSEYCHTDEPGLWLNVEIDDQGPISGPCREDQRDPGTSSSSFEGQLERDLVVRAYLTRGPNGPEVTSDSTVVGVAVYQQAQGASRVLGMRVPRTVEHAGRTWVLDSTISQGEDRRGPVRTVVDTEDGDQLLGLVGRGATVIARWDGLLTRGTSSYIGAGSGSASSIAGVLLAGDRYDVVLESEDGSDFDGVLVTYRPE